MTERQLHEALTQPVELPAEVEERLKEACAQAGGRTEKRRPRRVLRTGLLAACLAAGLCLAATAGYAVVRGEKVPDPGAALEGLFGNESRPSLQAQTEFDETGKQILALPDRERVPPRAGCTSPWSAPAGWRACRWPRRTGRPGPTAAGSP